MENNRNIFLSGGGSQSDSLLLDRLFVSFLGANSSVGYVPNAMQGKSYEECLDWFKSVFTPLGVSSIEMVTDLKKPEIAKLSGLYIGGGNTGKLLKEARLFGFDQLMKKIVYSGMPIYGGSAGAIILGRTISTAPESQGFTEDQRNGIDVLEGFSVFCHYDTKTDLSEMSQQCKVEKFFALPERGGLHLHEEELESVGYKAVNIYCFGKKFLLNPGEKINIHDLD
jgi:dipeptidase E